jgi:2-polyprenyl-3-methyl-5-hydroxy-6-metoxy-1,4-benzoquinol methylase
MKEDRVRQLDNVSVSQHIAGSDFNKQEGVRVGNLLMLAQPGKAALHRYKQRLLAQSYLVSETEHFVICRKPSSNRVLLMHLFGQAEINADLICFIEQELPPFGIIPSAQEFGATLFAVLASTFPSPRNQKAIWRRFCLNTLDYLRAQTAQLPITTPPAVSYIAPFAAIYRRIYELYVGQSLLDVGCSFGFLPVLMAEHGLAEHITGCDNNPDAVGFSTDLAASTGVQHVTFTLRDVLARNFACIGHYDTVTAIHLLEHLDEKDVPTALTHLLRVTTERLLIAVPYEEKAQELYGHRQLFNQEKLQRWGEWCVETLSGNARFWCEEIMGGLLVIERLPGEL